VTCRGLRREKRSVGHARATSCDNNMAR
jgi:hypothetical protein